MTRFLLYSHDTYGLGHFRRCGLIAEGLVATDPANEVLIVTGSPLAQSFSLPDRIDTVKLPSATKDETGAYRPRSLTGHVDRLIAVRSGIICAAVASYRPDVILVDHAPVGMGGELVPMLEAVARSPHRPRLVLGMRDVVDEASTIERTWRRDGVWGALGLYDDILVYGDPRIGTTATELALDRRVPGRVVHVGYVAPTMPAPITDDPYLLVTPGGGGDGHRLLRAHLGAVESGLLDGIRSVVVTGPLLSVGQRAEIVARAGALGGIDMREFADDMRALIAGASGVISMAGYNTVVEELSAQVPALLVPRSRPRREQQLRAERLSPFADLRHTPVERLCPRRVAAFARRCDELDADRRTVPAVDLGGVATAVAHLTGARPCGPAQERTPAHA